MRLGRTARTAQCTAGMDELKKEMQAEVGSTGAWHVSRTTCITHRGHVSGEVPPAHVEGPVHVAHPGDVHVTRDHKGLAAAELEAGVAVTCTAVDVGA